MTALAVHPADTREHDVRLEIEDLATGEVTVDVVTSSELEDEVARLRPGTALVAVDHSPYCDCRS